MEPGGHKLPVHFERPFSRRDNFALQNVLVETAHKKTAENLRILALTYKSILLTTQSH